MKKDCMVQYSAGTKMLVDTDLITRKEADEIFNDCKQKIKEYCIDKVDSYLKEQHEAALWINCSEDEYYQDSAERIHSDDIKVIDGLCYVAI